MFVINGHMYGIHCMLKHGLIFHILKGSFINDSVMSFFNIISAAIFNFMHNPYVNYLVFACAVLSKIPTHGDFLAWSKVQNDFNIGLFHLKEKQGRIHDNPCRGRLAGAVMPWAGAVMP